MKTMLNRLENVFKTCVMLLASAAAAFAARAAEQPWHAGVLTVNQGDVVNLSQDYATNYVATARQTAVVLHGDMTVTSPHYFVYCWDGAGDVAKSTVYLDLAGESGDTGCLTLNGGSLDSFYSNGRRLSVRDYGVRPADDAAISLRNGSTLTIDTIWVTVGASSTGDYMTELDIGADCDVQLQQIYTRSGKPVKLKFSGNGSVLRGWTYSNMGIFNIPQNNCGGFVVEGTPSSPVVIHSWESGNSDQGQLLLNSNYSNPKLTFQGDCDVRLVSSNVKTPIAINHSKIEFRQTGDLVLAGAWGGGCATRVTVENVLPFGAGVGNVRVLSNKGRPAHTLDLCGGSQKLNGLMFENGSQVVCTNGAVTLTFGTGDVDGVLDGLDSANVSVVKTGSGTLTITNATVASMIVSNGLVVVDGGVLTCGSLTTEEAGRVTCVNGGRIVAASGSATWELPATGDNRHAVAPSSMQVDGLGLYYGGTTTTTCLDGGTFGDVNVQSGILRIGGTLVSDLYWRVTFTGAQAGMLEAKWDGASSFSSRLVSLALGRLHPFSVDGQIANVATAQEGHFASETATAVATVGTWSFREAITYLGWSLATGQQSIGFTTEALSPENPIVVTVKTKTPIWGYGMSRAGDCAVGAPAAWKVESSVDGQTGWTLRDERTNQAERSVNMGWQNYGNDGVPYPLSSGALSSFCSTGLVEVAAGATLNLSEISAERIAIHGLRVNASSGGGGTITRFVPAANGRAEIDDVPASALKVSGNLRTKMALFTINEAFNENRLSGWSVVVNGRRVNASLKIMAGVLYAVPIRGAMLNLR
ncbi:MAG: hypothetical protein IKO72_04000 [Kiritimatiellae bacterium]|nr:hypothetical protein [Kiritimatiellia bacterium]